MITIKEIANIANVSVGTVDRVIHDREGVSKKTKERIQKILKDHNFKINMIARSLAMKKKYNISVLMPEFDDDNLFWKSPLMGVSKAADEVLNFGVEVEIFTFDQLHKNEYIAEFEKILNNKPDAVIFTPFFLNETKGFVKILEEMQIPYVFLNIDIEGFNNVSFIGQDSIKGGYLSGKLMHLCTGDNATYLITHIVSESYNNNLIDNRIVGFLNYFNDKNIPCKMVFLQFENFKDLNVVEKKIIEVFDENNSIKGVLVPSSRISTISKCMKSIKNKNLKLIGFDTTEQNIDCLKRDEITFLISQKSFNQGYKSVKVITDFLTQNINPDYKFYSPIEIITKENLEFSQQNKWQYSIEKE